MNKTAQFIELVKFIPQEDRDFLKSELEKMIDDGKDIVTIDEIYIMLMLFAAKTRAK